MDNSLLHTNQTVSLRIVTQEKILFQGEVLGISSVNEKGLFDVLPGHENFISLIQKSLTLHAKDKKSYVLTIQRGVVKVEQDKVEVYLITS